MAITALMSVFAALTEYGEKVAEMLGLDFVAEDVYTELPLRQQLLDPQLSLTFSRRGPRRPLRLLGEKFSVLVVAHRDGWGLNFVADGDTQIGDWEGYEARQLWHAAVCEELAVLIQEAHPREALRLRGVALDLHTPKGVPNPTTEDFFRLFAAEAP